MKRRKELTTLSKEERKIQQLALKYVIKNANVVLKTLTGAFTKLELVIIYKPELGLTR